MTAKIFISHSSEDLRYAEQLCNALEASGIPCWIAPRDIAPTMSWGEAIVKGIQTSDHLLLLLSDEANQSRHVAREVERADNFEKPIIPVRLEAVTPSDELGYFLGRIQWLDCPKPDFEMALAGVVDHIEGVIDPAPPPQVAVNPFWQGMTEQPLQIVLGRFLARGAKTPEAIGYGDRKGLIELRNYLIQAQIQNYSVIYADLLDKSMLTGNLYLIGGTGANSVSKRFVKAVPQGFKFQFARGQNIKVIDTVTDTRYISENMRQGDDATDGIDYGVVVVAPNPFAESGRVVYVSGSYSYATWACVQYTLTDAFADTFGDPAVPPTEMLLKVTVEDQKPAGTEVVVYRALPGN